MAGQLQLYPDQIRDFAIIRDLSRPQLRMVVESLKQSASSAFRFGDLFAVVSDALGDDGDGAQSLVRQLLLFHGPYRQIAPTAAEFLAEFFATIERTAEWSEEELERWRQIQPDFAEIIDLPSVRLIAKANELCYEYPNIYHDARILTDVRPLFNDEASEIEAAVVTHTLRLQFDAMGGRQEICVVLDDGDVRKLAFQCERAIVKGSTAQKIMNNKAGIPTIVSGEEIDA